MDASHYELQASSFKFKVKCGLWAGHHGTCFLSCMAIFVSKYRCADLRLLVDLEDSYSTGMMHLRTDCDLWTTSFGLTRRIDVRRARRREPVRQFGARRCAGTRYVASMSSWSLIVYIQSPDSRTKAHHDGDLRAVTTYRCPASKGMPSR